jgi:hypothetical protein
MVLEFRHRVLRGARSCYSAKQRGCTFRPARASQQWTEALDTCTGGRKATKVSKDLPDLGQQGLGFRVKHYN